MSSLDRLNGQFALVWWQPRPRRRSTLIRDRFGVRPLHYSLLDDGSLIFGSEVKAIFASGEVDPAPDLRGIDDVFTLWGPRPPRTVFRGVNQLAQGGLLVWEAGRIVEERIWWSPSFDLTAPGADRRTAVPSPRPRSRWRSPRSPASPSSDATA